MNYKHIENLVLLCKADNEEAKETLVSEFNPFITNLCKKSFVSGYEFEDIRNECYRALIALSYIIQRSIDLLLMLLIL